MFTDSQRYIGFLNSSSILKELNFPFKQFYTNNKVIEEVLEVVNSVEYPVNIRLGKRIEKYLKSYFENHNKFEIVAENLQIFNKGKTLGEIDFIIKNTGSLSIIHIELAYKFYLLDKQIIGEEADQWIGPNRKDNLSLKTNKFLRQQFPILHLKETQEKLTELNLNVSEIEQLLCFSGQLFLPYEIEKETFSSKLINEECIVGKWIRVNDFTQNKFGNYQIKVLDKKDWLVPCGYIENWNTYTEITPYLKKINYEKQSIMIAIKQENQLPEKLFIVWWQA